jgi:hypothetical protein
MRNIFIDLNELVHDRLSPEMMATPAESQAAHALALDHIKKLPIALSNSIVETTTKKAVIQLVQTAQLTASVLLAKLVEYQAAKPNALYDKTEQQLIDFIFYLRRHYNGLFNTAAIMPERIWRSEKATLERYLAMLSNTTGQDIDPELPALVRATFEEMVQDVPLSFAATDYWNKLLQKLSTQTDLHNQETAFLHTLMAYDFNSKLFIQYIFRRTEIETFTGNWLKNLCSTPETEKLTLDPHRLSCKQHFMEWMHHYTTEPNGVAVKNKIELSLSVAQLGVLLWLLVITGIIVTNNISELIRIIAANIRTTKTGSISPDSLHKHFYTRQQPAKSILLSMLRSMMQRLYCIVSFPLALFTCVSEGSLSASVAESCLALI